eukprot:TRINITY_DN655_c1_g1_i2.p1 TRINITY_DN655_c1_g1~~TRINITY_DN655_c1_g1_i2.p1  ORF type:complete len:179 (-),score=44.84 TRINITY_DN655_c1_g1_i2:134-622(-)
MAVPEEEVHEVFKLFDQDGGGIKIKEIGTVMRSLGLAVQEAQLQTFRAEAAQQDPNYVQWALFKEFVKKAETMEASTAVDVVKNTAGLKDGILHFFDKLPSKQIRESPPDNVKIADLKHLLSSCGDKMTEEEIEDMAREIRANCKTQDGRVDFEDFITLLRT